MCTHTQKSVVMFIAVPVHSSKKLKTNQIIIVYSHNSMWYSKRNEWTPATCDKMDEYFNWYWVIKASLKIPE